MNIKVILVCVVLFAAYTFAIWKWSASHLREELLTQEPPRDTTVATDTGVAPPAIHDTLWLTPGPASPSVHVGPAPDSAGIAELRGLLASRDSLIDHLSATFQDSIAQYGHRVHLYYDPGPRLLFYDWTAPSPLTTTTTITETRYLPASEDPFWFTLHAGGRADQLAGGLTLGVGPFGLTGLAVVGGKPLMLASFQSRFSAFPWPF